MNESENRENRRKEIEFSIGPAHIKLRGYDILLTIIVASLAAFSVYFYNSDQTIAAEHHLIMEKTEKTHQVLTEIKYILSVPEPERKNLHIEMPESLRKGADK